MAEEGRKIFVFGHPEYDRLTLEKEYVRDKNKGLDIQVPKNDLPDDNSDNRPLLTVESPCEYGCYTKLDQLLCLSEYALRDSG